MSRGIILIDAICANTFLYRQGESEPMRIGSQGVSILLKMAFQLTLAMIFT